MSKSKKDINKIAETLWDIEVKVGNGSMEMKDAIPKIESIASSCSLEELLLIDDIIYQKYNAART